MHKCKTQNTDAKTRNTKHKHRQSKTQTQAKQHHENKTKQTNQQASKHTVIFAYLDSDVLGPVYDDAGVQELQVHAEVLLLLEEGIVDDADGDAQLFAIGCVDGEEDSGLYWGKVHIIWRRG